jgi:hypothetical protein
MWIIQRGCKCQSFCCSTLWRRGVSLAHCRPVIYMRWIASACMLSHGIEAFLWHTVDHVDHIPESQVPVSTLQNSPVHGDEAFLWHTTDHVDWMTYLGRKCQSLRCSTLPRQQGISLAQLKTMWITYLGRKCQSPHCSTLLWRRGISLAHCRPCGLYTWVASASLLVAVLPHVGTVLRHAACYSSRLGQNT